MGETGESYIAALSLDLTSVSDSDTAERTSQEGGGGRRGEEGG